MSTRAKIWLVVAAALILLGGLLFTTIMVVLDWDFFRLGIVDVDSQIKEIIHLFTTA